ncbi:CMP-N-acetylneuraminate-beta-galactosamide-alpha-2,3-sialyltransferase 1-like isoform X2 [Siniperca chuatsi]|uniref:CMP-N-acetylneuraminate-beta-galactosamide- alpha-2,3-sialyltransferase 1-like isoform X2 n=1 Tax=Siniperca chuatsi TaxID=119488 RepID=UPI001CE163B3|nr:CMP-N-acetylneuraminate-beta-galactosamide-alpha-2,3-sialyltransferase 1-like isoform X2 [Siniperca chuatsi]
MNSKVRVIIFLLCVTGISVFLNGHVLGRYSKYFFQLQDTSPCACEKCLSEDDLNFFNKSVEPFLSANYILSEDTFNWWKRLQNEARNFSTYKTTVDRLFQMFPPGPDVKEPSPDLCRTCAVVGNSRNLKGSHYGPLIDVNDIIMRSYGPVKSKIKANKDLVMLINPAFMRYVHEVWLEKKGKYPSTGFMAFVLALHICDEVHVFGFGADKYRNWSHYWEKLKDSNLKTGPHPGTDEYRIIQKVAEQQKIKFYTGW